MKILYIGQYTQGTTSKMRADILNELLKPQAFNVIDTNIPFLKTPKLYRSIGFRYKLGPLINSINNYISNELTNLGISKNLDFIWIDKGIFLDQETVDILRGYTNRLIHFTPDMAFYKNRSTKFEKAIHVYDYLVTTKTMEIKNYLELIPKSKLIITTQGFSKEIHRPMNTFEEKDESVAFIGLAEPHRFKIIQHLIDNGIHVKIAGKGWGSFVRANKMNNFLAFQAEGLFSDEYSKFLSSASFGLGLLSKKFPELHTTRTFEIPACGTALLTESNQETSKYFNASNAIFYNNTDDLLSKIRYYLDNKALLKELSINGYNNVIDNGFDYYSIIKEIVDTITRDNNKDRVKIN